jgi:hypothetical protein
MKARCKTRPEITLQHGTFVNYLFDTTARCICNDICKSEIDLGQTARFRRSTSRVIDCFKKSFELIVVENASLAGNALNLVAMLARGLLNEYGFTLAVASS